MEPNIKLKENISLDDAVTAKLVKDKDDNIVMILSFNSGAPSDTQTVSSGSPVKAGGEGSLAVGTTNGNTLTRLVMVVPIKKPWTIAGDDLFPLATPATAAAKKPWTIAEMKDLFNSSTDDVDLKNIVSTAFPAQ